MGSADKAIRGQVTRIARGRRVVRACVEALEERRLLTSLGWGDELTLGSGSQPQLHAMDDGGVAVSWTRIEPGSHIVSQHLRRFSALGEEVGSEITISDGPGAIWLADGVVRAGTEGQLGFVPDALMDDPPETKRGLLEAYGRALRDFARRNAERP